MAEVIAGLLVFSMLCFAIKSLRIWSVASLSLLAALFPRSALALALIGGVVYLLFFHRST